MGSEATAATLRNIGRQNGGYHHAVMRPETNADVEWNDIEGLLAQRADTLAAVARHLASDASWALLEWHRRRAREENKVVSASAFKF